ncbi:MAG: DDE-type integrase/transposase/recombinase [Planctomycetes bacterium]|nr:DDE-type integrase/transposase/recombinase [Planctomycetota bacterium]
MENEDEKWALFWCDILRPVIFEQIEPEGINQFLKQTARDEVVFPDGRKARASVATLRRKLNRFNNGGFNALFRKGRSDRGKARKTPPEVIAAAIELKKEQPYRSDRTINRFLKERYDITIPRSTLYRHLKQAGATRIKLGISKMKIRKRIEKDHTHDLWVGDFEEGPYVIETDEVLPTYLCAFIDHYSRYVVDARYYLRQNLDILIDSWLRALAVHGAPQVLYVDNAKVYHSTGLKTACYRLKIRLKHRPPGEAETGGVIERLFGTTQSQFEREVRAGDILSLRELNRTFSAWLSMAYHNEVHSEIGQTPRQHYQKGLRSIRHVDVSEVMAAFMQRVRRTVNATFCDIRLDNKFYRCDPKLRADRVEVRYDPFSSIDSVEIYSLSGQYLQTAHVHNRESAPATSPIKQPGKPENNYLDLLVRQHNRILDEQTKGIDYRKLIAKRAWPFHQFAKTLSDLLGLQGGLSAFSAEEIERLKKTFSQCAAIDKPMLQLAFGRAYQKTLPYVCHELKLIIKEKENN